MASGSQLKGALQEHFVGCHGIWSHARQSHQHNLKHVTQRWILWKWMRVELPIDGELRGICRKFLEIWNIIPPCGNNLKNITQFCGYARKASIIKLKEKHEVDKMNRFSTSGTAVYLALMHHIKECFFNKAISPATRLYLIWKVVFFMRIWRTWLECNELSESDHFITNNAYVYIELNAHMLLNLVYNVATKTFPIECLRVWTPGSQSCEQLFRLLRSMTPTFSTVVNFSMKGILEKIHKLGFMSSSESDNSILFPRLGRRLFQIKEDTGETFCIPTVQSMTQQILDGKRDAVKLAADCGMRLTSYSDRDLVKGLEYAVNEAVSNDNEDLCEEALLLPNNEDIMESNMQSPMTQAELLCANEDLSVSMMRRNEAPGIPICVGIEESVGENQGRTYNVEKRPNGLTATKSPFIQYNGAYH